MKQPYTSARSGMLLPLKRLPNGASAPPLILSCLICELSQVLESAVEFTVSPCTPFTVSSFGEGTLHTGHVFLVRFFLQGSRPPDTSAGSHCYKAEQLTGTAGDSSEESEANTDSFWHTPPCGITRTQVHRELLVCVRHNVMTMAVLLSAEALLP